MKEKTHDTVPCAICGCLGNMSCGHEPLTDKYCTLDGQEVCFCCNFKKDTDDAFL